MGTTKDSMKTNPSLAEFYRKHLSDKLVEERKEAREAGEEPSPREAFEKPLVKPYQKNPKRELDEERKRDFVPGYVIPGTIWLVLEPARKVPRPDGYFRRVARVRCTGCDREFERRCDNLLRGGSYGCRRCSAIHREKGKQN